MNAISPQNDDEDGEAVVSPAPSHPKAFDADQWASIPEDLREEVLERASWLAFRGAPSDSVLDLALRGMEEDLARVDVEPSWWSIRAIASNWPAMRRVPDGHYRLAILCLASAVEAAAWSEANEKGSVPDLLSLVERMLPEPAFVEIAAAVFESRVQTYQSSIFRSSDIEEAPEDPDLQGDDDYPYDDDEGFRE